MPFVSIELPEKMQLALEPFAKSVHALLHEALDIPSEKLKTKIFRLSELFVGNGQKHEHYAHIRLELMQGRDRQKLIEAVNQLLKLFREALQEQNPDIHCRVTAEFREIDRELLVWQQIP